MSLFLFFLYFTFALLIGSLTVSGWFMITRGRSEVLPDNSLIKKGMIFKGWYFFWTKVRTKKLRKYYTGEELRKIYRELTSFLFMGKKPAPSNPTDNIALHFAALQFMNYDYWKSTGKIEQFCEDNDIKVWVKEDGYVIFFREYPDFIFPEWVRKPLAECVTCFSSIYGTLFYWTAMALPSSGVYAWSSDPVVSAILLWGAFCFSLAVLSTAIIKTYG